MTEVEDSVTRITMEAPVVEVTVLEDRSHVTRRGSVELPPGRTKVRVEGVAPVLSDKTLAVAMRDSDGAKVTDARVERRMLSLAERTEFEHEQIVEQVQQLMIEDHRLNRGKQALGGQRILVDQMVGQVLEDVATDVAWGQGSAEDWQRALEELTQRERAVRDEQLALDRQEKDLGERRRDVIARKESLSRPDMKLATAIEIDIEADAQTNCTLDVSYIVPAACWRPQHTARLVSGDGGGQKVIFEVDGCVWQRTGEDWTDAKLRFSTQRLSLGTEPPLLSDDVLAVKRKPPEVDVEAREQTIQVAGLGKAGQEAPEVPGVDDGGETFALAGATPLTVVSNGRPHRVNIFSFESEAETELVCMPEAAQAVVKKVMLANRAAHPVLAGPVDLVVDGGLIGHTPILFVAPDEKFEIGFGPDAALRVRRNVERVDEKAGTLGRYVRQKITVKLNLSNTGGQTRSFEVRERIPVSQVEQVQIDFDAKGTTPSASPDKDGFVVWQVTLPAGGQKKVSMKYTLTKHRDVVGLP